MEGLNSAADSNEYSPEKSAPISSCLGLDSGRWVNIYGSTLAWWAVRSASMS